MDVKVAIPTHGRSDMIEDKTLFLLRNLGLDITIFANPFGEARKYEEVLGDKYKIVEIEEFDTMGKLRNDILDYYEDGDKILMIDDDVSSMYKLYGKKKLQMTDKELMELIEQGFGLCEASGYKLWGVCPTTNPLSMNDVIKYNKFIIGTFMGIIKTDLRFDKNINNKEDYDFTLQNIVKFGGTIRFDGVCTDNKYLKTKGGLQDAPRTQTRDVLRLKAKWGDKVIIRDDKEGEVLLNV